MVSNADAGLVRVKRNKPRRFRSAISNLSLAILTVRLHIDAVRYAPVVYLEGMWWHLTGKRLRARARLSPLLGRSPAAYRVWLARNAHEAKESGAPCTASVIPSVVVVIDASADPSGLPITLASLDNPSAAIIMDKRARIPGSYVALRDIALHFDRAGNWLIPLHAGDKLTPGTERYYAEAAASAATRIIYADDDLLEKGGALTHPHFKPGWNRELFHHHDYISGSCIVQTHRHELATVNGFPDWIERLVATVALECEPRHLPIVLHHRAARPAPKTLPPPNLPARDAPKVCVIIPTRNGTDLLRTCLKGLSETRYPHTDVIIVDNDSDDPETLSFLTALAPDKYTVIKHRGPFNYSAINNIAVRHASAPMLCFLNNDIEMLEPDWLSILVAQALRDDVGAVGPMLLYPDRTVQHAGVVLGVGGGAAHAHRQLRPDEMGYFRRHALPQFVSAVTGACLVVTRKHFDAAGGFDETNFPVAFNDVDLCLKLTRLGHRTLYEPRARLIHHESKSRGNDRDPVGAERLAQELRALKNIWRTDQRPDAYHHPSLSPFSEQFVIDL